jgi:hypothetical protein
MEKIENNFLETDNIFRIIEKLGKKYDIDL